MEFQQKHDLHTKQAAHTKVLNAPHLSLISLSRIYPQC